MKINFDLFEQVVTNNLSTCGMRASDYLDELMWEELYLETKGNVQEATAFVLNAVRDSVLAFLAD